MVSLLSHWKLSHIPKASSGTGKKQTGSDVLVIASWGGGGQSCSACSIAVFLPYSLAMGQAVMLFTAATSEPF